MRTYLTKRLASGILFLGINFLFCSSSFAGGFTIYGHDIDTAMSLSTIANTLGPSSNIFNPALLPEIEGNQVSFSTTLIMPKTEFTDSSTGISEESKDKVFYPTTVSTVYHFNDKMTGGFVIYNPFGLGSFYPEEWSGRYIAVKSELTTFNINPNMAYRISDSLNISIGLDVTVGMTTMSQKVKLLSDATNELTGYGRGLGFNLGVLYKMTKRITAGIAYRSKIKFDIDGDLKFSDVPSDFQSLVSDSKAHIDLNLPSLLYFGIACRLSDHFLFEIGGKIEDWASYNELKVRLDDPVLGMDTIVIPKDWDKTYIFNMGAKYTINPSTLLLAGYLFEKNPVPDETFDPTVPVSKKNTVTMGIAKIFSRFTLNITYALEKVDDREKANDVGKEEGSPLMGTFKTGSHSVGFGINYKF